MTDTNPKTEMVNTIANQIAERIREMKKLPATAFPHSFGVKIWERDHLATVDKHLSVIPSLIIGDSLVDTWSYDEPDEEVFSGSGLYADGFVLRVNVAMLDGNASLGGERLERTLRDALIRMDEQDGRIEVLETQVAVLQAESVS